jgi:hypothetical protein
LILTVNGFATAWLFSRNGTILPFARMVFGVFIVLDLMGTVATLYSRRHMHDCDRRITKIIEGLTQRYVTEVPCSKLQFPLPRQAIINIVFGFFAAALFIITALLGGFGDLAYQVSCPAAE